MTDLIILLLFPFPLCTIAFVVAVVLLPTRRRKLGVVIAMLATVVLLVCGTSPVPTWLMTRLEQTYPGLLEGPDFAARTAGVQYVVILGGTSVANQQLPITSRLSPSPLGRAVEGARIHRLLPGSRIVTSGGGAGPTSERQMIADLLMSIGVEKGDILTDQSASNTYEEALAVQRIAGNAKIVLVTSASHMPRAVALFRHVGLQPVPAPTDHFVKQPLRWELAALMPRVGYFQLFEAALYEYLAQVKDRARGRM